MYLHRPPSVSCPVLSLLLLRYSIWTAPVGPLGRTAVRSITRGQCVENVRSEHPSLCAVRFSLLSTTVATRNVVRYRVGIGLVAVPGLMGFRPCGSFAPANLPLSCFRRLLVLHVRASSYWILGRTLLTPVLAGEHVRTPESTVKPTTTVRYSADYSADCGCELRL